jgi:hypothetical protein
MLQSRYAVIYAASNLSNGEGAQVPADDLKVWTGYGTFREATAQRATAILGRSAQGVAAFKCRVPRTTDEKAFVRLVIDEVTYTVQNTTRSPEGFVVIDLQEQR